MAYVREHERLRLDEPVLCRIVDQKTNATIDFVAIDVSKQGFGVIVQRALTPLNTFRLVGIEDDSSDIVLELVWIDYDSHEQRYRCGFRSLNSQDDIESFVLERLQTS